MKPISNSKENNGSASAVSAARPDEAVVADRADKTKSRLAGLILFVILSAAFSLYCAMITPGRFGDYGDDGIYASAAKALATGQGYRIISLPQEKPQTVVPPLYPLLLSLIWRAWPEFPGNVAWMMLLSAAATVTFLFLTYRYLTRRGYASPWQALIIVALAGINWRTMLHGTSVMSEMTYAALSVGGLYLAEKYEKEREGHVAGIAAGVVIGLAYLTRSSGLALLVAVAAYYLLRRQWKRALLPVGVACLFVLAWMGWSYLNRSTAGGANALYYSGYSGGVNQTISDLQVLNNTSRFMTLLNVIGTNALLLIIGSIPLACLGLRYDLPQIILVSLVLITIILIAAGFIRKCRRGICLPCIYLISYLGLHVVHPGIAYDRYIMPIVPFLLYFLVSELSFPVATLKRELTSDKHLAGKLIAAFIALVLLAAAAIVVLSNAFAIHQSLNSLTKVSARASEDAEAIEWIKAHTDSSDVLVCNRDMIYYLYTGRKATPSFRLSSLDGIPYQTRQPEPDELTRTFQLILAESGGQYLVSNSYDFADMSDFYQRTINGFIRQHPEKFAPVFESTDKNSVIYRIKNDAQSHRQ